MPVNPASQSFEEQDGDLLLNSLWSLSFCLLCSPAITIVKICKVLSLLGVLFPGPRGRPDRFIELVASQSEINEEVQ